MKRSGSSLKHPSRRICVETETATASKTQRRDPAFRNGKILRIRLINFMCHSNLVVNFNKQVNLLVGNNGSGKSAILTALVVGLGSNASATNRSTNLQNLIKTGEQSATIEIEISNDIQNSYEPTVYGKKIIVVRQISKSSSDYKIKNESGQIVSTNRRDLTKILLFLNIQTDNPVFVLNQDNARSFLKDLDPKKNYKVLLKATQIETIEQKLNACCVMYSNQERVFQYCITEKNQLLGEFNKLLVKYQALQSKEAVKQKITELSSKKLWIHVKNQENIINEMEKQMNDLMHKCNILKEKIKNQEVLENQLKDNIRNWNEEKNQYELENRNAIQMLNHRRDEYNKTKDLYDNAVHQHNTLEKKIERIEEQNATLKMTKFTAGHGNNKMQRKENELKITSLKQENVEISAMIANTKMQLRTLVVSIQKLKEDLHDVKYQEKAHLIEIENAKSELRRLQASAQMDSLSVYGEYMRAVRNKIEQYYEAGKFSKLPRGPLGSYVEVPNKNVRPIMERILGHFLHAFMVDTDKDRNVLIKLLSKFNLNSPIICGKFHKTLYDISGGCVREFQDAGCAINQIKCHDPIVMNCLIDKTGMERILLTEDQNLAIQLTDDERNVPENLQKVILLDPFLEYYPAPLYRVYSMNINSARFLQVSTKKRMRQIVRDIKNIEKKKSMVAIRIQEIKKTIEEQLSFKTETQKTLSSQENDAENNRRIIEDLENVIYPKENERKILEKELEIEQNILDVEQRKSTLIKESIEQFLKDFKEAEQAFIKQEKFIPAMEKSIEKCKKNCDDKYIELQKMQSKREYWDTENETILNNLIEIRKNYKAQIKIVNNSILAAEKNGCEHNDTEETLEDVEKQIENLSWQLTNISKIPENIDELHAMIQTRQSKYDKCVELCDTLDETLSLLKKQCGLRFRMMKNLKRHMSLRIMYMFQAIMKLRDYTGSTEIDHQNQTLKIKIIPRDNSIQNAVSNTKSLSGGERSYSTIALLISLWSCVDHPFFVLDEYDVYTDQYNRVIMTELLLNEAKKRPDCQYIFLTPQDLSFVQPSDTINIIRLADPDRVATTHHKNIVRSCGEAISDISFIIFI